MLFNFVFLCLFWRFEVRESGISILTVRFALFLSGLVFAFSEGIRTITDEHQATEKNGRTVRARSFARSTRQACFRD